MEGFASAITALMHNGNLYNQATELLNSSIGQEGFHIWIDLPDGTQFVIPKGSTIRTLNYVPIISDNR